MKTAIPTQPKEEVKTSTGTPNQMPASRSVILNSDGVKYVDFLRTLSPRYSIVWRDIAFGYCAIFAIAVGEFSVVTVAQSALLTALTIFSTSILFGLALHYLAHFIHEASHFNLAPSKGLNDLLANVFIGALFGQDMRAYRPVHFDHHRHLGTDLDPEHVYHLASGWRFLIETPLIVVWKVVFRQINDPKVVSRRKATESSPILMLLVGLIINATILYSFLSQGLWQLALSWAFGMLVCFPIMSVIRQVTEHKVTDIDAACLATTRIFSPGWFAAVFGSAGFNRHLLHHWEPHVSYTRLAELENYLLDTELRTSLDDRRSTYGATFRRVFGHF